MSITTAATDLAARAWFSAIFEPGDATAGALVRVLGHAPALEALEHRPAEVRAILAEDDVDDATIRTFLDRYKARRTPADPVAAAEKKGLTLVNPDDVPGLADLGDHAPHVLYVRGDAALLVREASRIVVGGARACTPYGEQITADITGALAESGHQIITGGAYGVEGVATRAALRTGTPTVVITAGGVDRAYPAGHAQLLDRVADTGGAVASEVAPGTTPTRWRFLARLRTMAALSSAVVITEAGARSGSLALAGYAEHFARPIGAVPGPVTSATSAGCHTLIRDGRARLITSAADAATLTRGATDTDRIRAVLTPDPLPVADIATRAGLPLDDAILALAPLFLDGTAIETTPGHIRHA